MTAILALNLGNRVTVLSDQAYVTMTGEIVAAKSKIVTMLDGRAVLCIMGWPKAPGGASLEATPSRLALVGGVGIQGRI